jgi:hypothetical protein
MTGTGVYKTNGVSPPHQMLTVPPSRSKDTYINLACMNLMLAGYLFKEQTRKFASERGNLMAH